MKRVCYYPNWSQYRIGAGRFVVRNIDPELCTHLVFAFSSIDSETFKLKHHDINDTSEYQYHCLEAGGRFIKGLGALFSVQSIPVFPPKQFSETVPRYTSTI
jgi:GH18 family chitinase